MAGTRNLETCKKESKKTKKQGVDQGGRQETRCGIWWRTFFARFGCIYFCCAYQMIYKAFGVLLNKHVAEIALAGNQSSERTKEGQENIKSVVNAANY
jgi:hypothetical protein